MSLLATAAAWLVEPPDEHDDIALLEPRQPAPDARRRAALWPIAAPDDEPTPLALSRAAHAPPPIRDAAAPARLAVVGTASAVPALAAATALACRARARVPAALVALWRAGDVAERLPGPGGGPVLPGAAALASRLTRRDLAVTARGRLVWLRLPADDDAATLLRRAEAALGDLPAVLAVARPRDAAVDAVLTERELLLLAVDADSPLAAAAGADVAALGVPAHVCRSLPPGATRLAALAGLRAPRLAPAPARQRSGRRQSHPIEEAW